MTDPFLIKAREIIEQNLGNEQFGVSELADAMSMSRSNLLRKLKKASNLSASQFIRQQRLEHAMKLLKTEQQNVSEVSFAVGFSSTSYFIKCFREQFGYPPGELGKNNNSKEPILNNTPKKSSTATWAIIAFALVAIILSIIFIAKPFKNNNIKENSIAVLPFKNDSNDSSNVYLINGLMESLLTNLQQIEDLRVISRTSVEKFRNNQLSLKEIAKELDVAYIVEGSGQKIDEQILLNIQLLDATKDKHLWAKQYERKSEDIFELQKELALRITEEISAIITPEEKQRIDKAPTNNLIAYDYFLKGQHWINQESEEGLRKSIPYFMKAIEYDDQFARSYANIAIAYAYLDKYIANKIYSDSVNHYASIAYELDNKSVEALIGKALFYMNTFDAEKAVPFLEDAIKYSPNSAFVLNLLSEFYSNYLPDKDKYIEYALRGIRIDIAAHDSSDASYMYLHIGNAFIQSGFVSEALLYMDKALDYNPNNSIAEYVMAYVIYARDRDLEQTLASLIEILDGDMTRFDIIQEIAKMYYYLDDFENAYIYYQKFLDILDNLGMDLYPFEDAKIAVVMDTLGYDEKAAELMESYYNSAINDNTLYKQLSIAMYYSYTGETDKAIEHLKLFSKEDGYYYWILLFLELDPLAKPLLDHPEFPGIMETLNSNFQKKHDKLKASLFDKGLLN